MVMPESVTDADADDGEYLTIDSAGYDPSMMLVSFSGTTSQEMVNICVVGEGYMSTVTAESSVSGKFSGSIRLELSGPAVYQLQASSIVVTASKQFVVAGSEVQLSLLSASYDRASGMVSFAGTSDSAMVNLRLTGEGFYSPVTTETTDDGGFTGTLCVGQLSDGAYVLHAKDGSGTDASRQISVGQAGISIQSVSYDADTGIVAYSGSSDSGLVNIRVIGGSFVSQVNAETVSSGAFSGSMKVGSLDAGDYNLVASSGGSTASFGFSVGYVVIAEITDLYVDYVNWIVQFEGTTGAETLSAHIETEGGVMKTGSVEIDVSSGTFRNGCSIGGFEPGSYRLVIGSSDSQVTKNFVIATEDDEITDRIGNTMTGYGRTLVRFSGSVDEYTIPSTVELVSDDAFEGATISKFVYDRDLKWDITMNNRYPFEGCGVTSIDISEGVTVIPDYLFAKTSVSSIAIPSTVETIGVKSFYACSALESVTVVDGNRLTLIDSYAFCGGDVNSRRISAVTFGSSYDGYACDIGFGAFFLCDSLETVVLHDGFNLRSIGNVAFTKYATADEQRGIINFNSNSGILIPKEVEEIGWMAFSTAAGGVSPSTEPGKNTYMYGSPQTKFLRLNGSSTTISFEEGSVLVTIEERTFAGYPADSIDLSNCGLLETIKTSAFENCLSSSSKLVLSDSIEEMYSAFKLSSGTEYRFMDIEIPASVEVCINAFDGLSKTVRAASGSQLREYAGSRNDESTDLTACTCLETVKSAGKVKMNPGVYHLSGNTYDESMNVINGGWATPKPVAITSNVNIVGWEVVDFATSISCASDNPYIHIEENVLYFDTDGTHIVLKNLADGNVVLIDGSIVRDESLTDGVTGIILKGSATFSSESLTDCRGLEDIRYMAVQDNIDDLIEALAEMKNRPTVTVDGFLGASIIEKLSRWTEVRQGYEMDSAWILLNSKIDGGYLVYSSTEAGVITVSTEADLSRYVLECDGVEATLEDGTIRISSIVADAPEQTITVALNPVYRTHVALVLDYNGGTTADGKTSGTVSVLVGTRFGDVEFPDVRYDLHDLTGWTLRNGTVMSGDLEIDSGMSLIAVWTERSPKVFLDCAHVDVYSGQDLYSGGMVEKGASLTLTCTPHEGYEVLGWIVDGECSATDSFTLTSIEHDVYIGFSLRFYSSSSGLIAVSDRGLPTTAESSVLVMVSELGGEVDMLKSIWTGIDSVPLIVDGYIYFRAGGGLYKAESDTGYIVASVPSVENSDFYHRIAYGDGVIVDSLTGKAYDLDLNQIFVLSFMVGDMDYYDGYFYSSGSAVYRFSSADDDPNSTSERKTPELIGTMDHVYSNYGYSNSVFVGDYLYRVHAAGASRGIAAMDLTSGKTSVYVFRSMDYMYIDDGWISYNAGYLYLTGYTSGLFGAQAKTADSGFAYVKVDGLTFDASTEGYYEFSGKTSWASQVLFWDDKAYVSCGMTLYVFDVVNGVIQSSTVRTATMTSGHGSISMDVSRYDEDGSVYIYQIPYASTAIASMSIVEDKNGVLTYVNVSGLPANYNSQTVRPDIDGRVVWYNDTGHIFTYTTPEKNNYYFYVSDGTTSTWYKSSGATAADALKALGSDVARLDSANALASVWGSSNADGWKLSMLKLESLGKQYSWTSLDNLYDKANDTNHYYAILKDCDVPSAGTEFTYIGDGGKQATYKFADNIGDRSLVGKTLISGTDISVIRFYSGETEIEDSALIGVPGSTVRGSFPIIYKSGWIGIWEDSDGDIAKLPETFPEGGASYCITWFESYDLNISCEKSGSISHFTIKTGRSTDGDDLKGARILLIAGYDSGGFVNKISNELSFGSHGESEATIGVSNQGLVSVHAYVVSGALTGAFERYGECSYGAYEETTG